ncbi:hypothetical protein DWY56_15380 [Ruminococcus sp. AF25-3LB]|nr:hypothetical protein DWY56_15380 [Ruminococcus sp. AF25-3LB]
MKCRNGNFVKRFSVNSKLQEIVEAWNGKAETSKKYQIDDLQLFIFNNGIAFITVYLSYKNKDVNQIYKFINPGYVQESNDKEKLVQDVLLKALEEKVFGLVQKKMKITLSWFIQDKDSRKYIIKEAYRLNIASLPKRFEDNEIPKRIAYNGHRLVDVTRDFEDVSEMDVEYATGAKDVEDEHYGWACAITSQEISYAYGPEQGKTEPRDKKGLWVRSEDDLLLTMIVMYQKYTCMIFNERIHQRFTGESSRLKREESLRNLKREALEFISYGTLAPSQISRWNNVCETYRSLQKQNGVNELLEEISQKITLLNEEQDRIDGERESRVSMIITVFGLVSIISATLQMLDYISTGRPLMIIGFLATSVVMILFS